MTFVLFILQIWATIHSPGRSDFQAQTIDDNVVIGYGIALGDVDGDKKPDILLADKKQIVWYRNGDWKKFVMIENLTEHDNVCIAAQDLDGDGKVEVAVGAQWNPSETKDKEKSGSVHILLRPKDPTTIWKANKLYHEPTIHRMRWVRSSNGNFYLIVLPLHGQDNTAGAGTAVNMLVFQYPALLQQSDPTHIISTGMHLTHNLDVAISRDTKKPGVFIAGKEDVGFIDPNFSNSSKITPLNMKNIKGAGEIRVGSSGTVKNFTATIEPMHGNNVVIYTDQGQNRIVLDSSLSEGHALIASDFLGLGHEQVVAGWRRPNKDGKVGVKLYKKKNASSTEWDQQWIDENGMACEDLQVMDLNADGKMDIIASGRSTRNLKIYWNISKVKK
jgi:hypothetical protein